MNVVILAGGLGTRLSEETELIPKPMVQIGGMPILWHIMKHFSFYRHREFFVALGYKGEVIKDFFVNYHHRSNNMVVELRAGRIKTYERKCEDWRVHLIDTGLGTQTGGRIRRLRDWLRRGTFIVTYGDGVSDVNLAKLVRLHKSAGKLVTVTAVRPPARFGGIVFDGDLVERFTEKPQTGEGWINGGLPRLRTRRFRLPARRRHQLRGGDPFTSRRPTAVGRLPARWLLAVHGHPSGQETPGIAVEREPRPVEGVGMTTPFGGAFCGRNVFLTGHTGFIGSWLALWLNRLGARVTGYALEPPTQPSNFVVSGVEKRLFRHILGDIRDVTRVRAAMDAAEPDIVIHMAAHALVRESYASPVETFDANVVGTASVLDAVRNSVRPMVVLIMTSDKCYENDGTPTARRESDPMGGSDPYSASKGAAELVVASYRRSYFDPVQLARHGKKVATLRAGNAVGGGDWARDRIVPDIVRALAAKVPVEVRNPDAVRPWQHVLEPLSGCLTLAARMIESDDASLCSGWNFGPDTDTIVAVRTVVEKFCAVMGSGRWEDRRNPAAPPEARMLRLNVDKAASQLNWRARWNLDETLHPHRRVVPPVLRRSFRHV